MATGKSQIKLNKLQLRTLLLFQELAGDTKTAIENSETGEIEISTIPHVYGDNMHVGDLVVSSSDASGFSNKSVWNALERKRLIRSAFPLSVVLTKIGRDYDTGFRKKLTTRSDH